MVGPVPAHIYIYNNIYYNILFKNKKIPKKISRGILKYL
jgi:hypothetical protein